MNCNEIIAQCLLTAQAELKKIPYKDPELKLELTHTHYEHSENGFIEVSEGDRGHIFRKVANTPEEFVEYLLNKTVTRFAIARECKMRRPFEDNRRQVNEIVEDCYRYMDNRYQYTLLTGLKDNIHIYFDLLDWYVQVSARYLSQHSGMEGEEYLQFVATRQYAGKNGGMYDVAFCFDWVRYQLTRFLELHPFDKKNFFEHEEQYQRLLELEKTDPHEQKWYRLGRWNVAVFAEAERILDAFGTEPVEQSKVIDRLDSGYQCAFYMTIVRLHTGRDLERDLDTLLTLAEKVDIRLFEKPLEQLFVTDEYGVFGRAPVELRERARKQLGL